jgi:hypothetical protein
MILNRNRLRGGQVKLIPVGTRFGSLVVISFSRMVPVGAQRKAIFLCQCDCGRRATVIGSNLRSGNSKACDVCTHKAAIADVNISRRGKATTKRPNWKHQHKPPRDSWGKFTNKEVAK